MLLMMIVGLGLTVVSAAQAYVSPGPTGMSLIGSLRARCQSYARASVRQNGQNMRMRCGYRGRGWSSSLGFHYGWCLRVRASAGRIRSILHSREVALRRCRAAGGLRARCRAYAQNAANYNRINLRLRCGFRGPNWNSNPGYHFNWCFRNRVPSGRLAMLNRRRAEAVNRCRTGGGLRRRCRDYAQISVRQNQFNLRRRCGFRGPRWSSNRSYHYNWCLRHRVPPHQLNRIVQRRRNDLARCGGPRPPARRGFTFPRWSGDFLDYCLRGNQGCGKVTADAFCRSQGFARAAAFKGPWRTPSRTVHMGSGAACKKSMCQGFYFINCIK
jgi:hypothetical protein